MLANSSSLFSSFFGYLLSSMRTSKREREREKKSVDKKKRMGKKKEKKIFIYVCMSIYLVWLVRMVIKQNHYQDLNIHKLTIISLATIVNYIDET